MACLKVTVIPLSLTFHPNSKVKLITSSIIPLVHLIDKLYISIEDKHSNHLRVSCGIVCDVNDTGGKYLDVSPDEIQWITEDIGVIYTVYSNTDWEIEIN